MGPLQPVTGPLPVPANEGWRAARGATGALVENRPDPQDPDARWPSGFRFRRTACKGGGVTDQCSFAEMPDPEGPEPAFVETTPFAVFVDRGCSTRGMSAADYQAEARELLDLYQYDLISREFWRGDQAKDPDGGGDPWPNRYLARDAAPGFVNLVTDAAWGNANVATDSFSPVTGLAVIEAALALCSPGTRVIHTPPPALTYWHAEGLLRFEGGRILTANGTHVLTDTGYDGSSPDSLGNVAGTWDEWWAYGTGQVHLRLGAVYLVPEAGRVAEAVNRLSNDVSYRAERLAAATWDCCHVGARITVAGSTL